jgi:hypothetical protein
LVLDRNYRHRVYAKVKPKVRDQFVCRADRSAFGTSLPNPRKGKK